MVTVYRSMDATAKEDCQILIDILSAQGINAVMFDDSAPGVPEGTFELRVPAADTARAEKVIAENPLPDEAENFDPSASLDLVTVFRGEGAELEAMGIKSLLESNGIAAVLVGDSVLPNFPFEVRVARDKADSARQVIAEAQPAEPAEPAE